MYQPEFIIRSENEFKNKIGHAKFSAHDYPQLVSVLGLKRVLELRSQKSLMINYECLPDGSIVVIIGAVNPIGNYNAETDTTNYEILSMTLAVCIETDENGINLDFVTSGNKDLERNLMTCMYGVDLEVKRILFEAGLTRLHANFGPDTDKLEEIEI